MINRGSTYRTSIRWATGKQIHKKGKFLKGDVLRVKCKDHGIPDEWLPVRLVDSSLTSPNKLNYVRVIDADTFEISSLESPCYNTGVVRFVYNEPVDMTGFFIEMLFEDSESKLDVLNINSNGVIGDSRLEVDIPKSMIRIVIEDKDTKNILADSLDYKLLVHTGITIEQILEGTLEVKG